MDGNALNFDDTATIQCSDDDGDGLPDCCNYMGWECSVCGGCISTEYGPYASEEECYRETGCSNAFYESYMAWAGFSGQTDLSEEEIIDGYCTKCQSDSMPSPYSDGCGCCDGEYSIIRWACTRSSDSGGAFFDQEVGGVCVSSTNPNFPYATQEECEAGCPEEEEGFDCDDFDTFTSQEQDLVCCGCDPGCSFVPYLPQELMVLCGCCDSNILKLDKPIDISNMDRLIAKLKNKIGKTKSPQFDRLKELAGLKKRK